MTCLGVLEWRRTRQWQWNRSEGGRRKCQLQCFHYAMHALFALKYLRGISKFSYRRNFITTWCSFFWWPTSWTTDTYCWISRCKTNTCDIGVFNSTCNTCCNDPCLPGEYILEKESLICLKCPKNEYAKDPKETKCVSCPSGWIADIGSASCSACSAGSLLNDWVMYNWRRDLDCRRRDHVPPDSSLPWQYVFLF